MARGEREMSLAELAARTGISAGELSRIERGKRPSVGLPQVVQICDALSIRIEWLVYNRGPMAEDADPPGSRTKDRGEPYADPESTHERPALRRRR